MTHPKARFCSKQHRCCFHRRVNNPGERYVTEGPGRASETAVAHEGQKITTR